MYLNQGNGINIMLLFFIYNKILVQFYSYDQATQFYFAEEVGGPKIVWS